MTLNVNACRGLASFGVGVACFVLGSAVTATAVPGAALAAGSLTAGMLTGIGPNIASAVGHDALNATWSSIGARLRAASKRGGLPENHDLARALRRAQLLGLRHCVERCRDDVKRHPAEFDPRAISRFLHSADVWIEGELKRADASDFFIDAPADEPVRDAIALLTNERGSGDSSAAFRALDAMARNALLQELAAAADTALPDAFLEGFDGARSYAPGWRGAAFAFFAEQLKTDDRLRTVVFLERLNALLTGQAGADVRLAAGIDAILASTGQLSSRLDRVSEELSNLASSLDRLSGVASPPLRVPALPLTAHNPLSFASRSTPFLGRDAEMAALRRFVASPEPFQWLSVSGPGGAGKSRLLLEFLLSVSPAWTGGFIDTLRPGFDWGNWRRGEDVLIIIDYATTQAEQVRSIFASLSAQDRTIGRVRVILADRCDRTTLESRLFPGDDLYRFLPFSFGETLRLTPLAAKDLQRLAAAVTGSTDKDSSPAFPELPPESSFPLFAALAAQALSDGRFPRELDRVSIVRNWYEREKARHWGPMGVSRSEFRLACLATISGGLAAEKALSGALTPCGIDVADVETGRMEAITGERPLEWILPLIPDVLGEYFVLQMLLEQNPRSSIAKALLQTAWELSPERTAGFMERAAEDFPDHQAAISTIGYKPTDIAAAAGAKSLGRPTLPTMWAEIVPQLSLPLLFRHHRDAALQLILDACQVQPDHPRLAELKALFGAQMFDDPLCLNNLVMAYAEQDGAPDYGEARDLGLRLSDLRWRLGLQVGHLLVSLAGFEERQVDRILEAAANFLDHAKNDRRVRRDISGALLNALTERLEAGELRQAEVCWNLLAGLYDWWQANPDLHAHVEGNRERPTDPNDFVADVLHAKAKDPVASQNNRLAMHYLVFSTGEDSTDQAFIERYGKAASNFIMMLLKGGADPRRLALARRVMAKLESATQQLNGAYEYPARQVEALSQFVSHAILTGDAAFADEMRDRANALVDRFEAEAISVELGKTYVTAHVVDAHARLGQLDEAAAAFDLLGRSTTLPDGVKPKEREAVSDALFNFATGLLKQDPVRARRLIGFLDALPEDPAAPRLLEAKIQMRRNQMVFAMLAGRPEQAAELLEEVLGLAERARTPAEIDNVLAAVAPLMGGGTPSQSAARTVAAVIARALAAAAELDDPVFVAELLLHIRGTIVLVARAEIDAAQMISIVAGDVAARRFADAKAYRAELDKIVATARSYPADDPDSFQQPPRRPL